METKETRRVAFTMKIKPESKEKLVLLKQYNPDIPWDILLEPVLKDISLPKSQNASSKPPPKYVPQVQHLV